MPEKSKSKPAEPGYAYIYQGERLVRVDKTKRRKVSRPGPSSGKRKAG